MAARKGPSLEKDEFSGQLAVHLVAWKALYSKGFPDGPVGKPVWGKTEGDVRLTNLWVTWFRLTPQIQSPSA